MTAPWAQNDEVIGFRFERHLAGTYGPLYGALAVGTSLVPERRTGAFEPPSSSTPQTRCNDPQDFAPSTPASRLIPVSETEFWWASPAPWRGDKPGAFAIRFERDAGGADPIDIGPPYEPWRRTGEFEFASIDFVPNEDEPVFTFSNDLGAQDYALQINGSYVFGGSYHGGESIETETVRVDGEAVDPTLAHYGASLEIDRRSTVEYGPDQLLGVNFALTVSQGAFLSEATDFTSTEAFASGIFPHMEIASADFTQALLYDGKEVTIVDVAEPGRHDLSTQADVTLRDPQKGYVIRTVSSAPIGVLDDYKTTYVQRNATRSKLYFQLNSTAGEELGHFSVSRNTVFGKTRRGASGNFDDRLPPCIDR
ncbi:hypothetical protein PB2503_06822 [Parvularcula bermudensis HTCC2503]|uniref:Uncharacterized protein n=1 Tax=Parvularcula bermudensis (strain ATCC BAA-594 / HTCC2503 / KCTC 12087) TaxID=314260 RepID=E0TI91_PARBH|nr:hypothetical protein [Parvularcula bermudensis]ADM09430.1 hypothetical protein PB2503_06822 [Parvularcula bermudensis HTCC2503]